jgi:hypothetical protein
MLQNKNIPQAVFQVQQSRTDVFAFLWHNLMKAGAEVQVTEAWKSRLTKTKSFEVMHSLTRLMTLEGVFMVFVKYFL